ncbi:MAG: FkbM family methyltransferase [Cyanobacteriota bacterium]
MSRNKPLHVLQVGANDGIMYDPIDKLLLKHANISATRIEPISEYFFELQENCRRYASQVELFNICITEADGPIDMYFPDPNRSGQGGDKGHGSLRPEAVGRSREGWVTRTVSGKSFQSLMKEMRSPRADVYVSDCEGYDIQLLQNLPIEELGIKVIYIELLHQTMSWGHVAEGLRQVVEIVASHGFNRILWDGSDFLSWRAPHHSTSQYPEVEGFTRS